MPRFRILVVDDEQGMLEVCFDTLSVLENVEIVLEQEGSRAADKLTSESWDLLIADVRIPGIGGVDLLRLSREQDPSLAVLMMTAFPSVDTAVESMKLGAADYITKPFLPDDLLGAARGLLRTKQLRDENRLLLRQVERAYSFGALIGRSGAMQSIFEAIQQVAPTEADVLILGETGTGKELVARSIHQNSRRSKERFVPVDCGTVPEDLMESEFFGYERGAFTGAHSRSMGLMEFADGGTFFLDEIGDLPQRLQAKLLRALQERRVRRIGGKVEIEVDLRVVAATARNLDEEIQNQRFRSDLFYRINVARIELPPLRRRAEDIPILTAHFVKRYAKEMRKDDVEVQSEVIEVLACYPWPGNVRELQNVIKRTLAMTHHRQISVEDLPDEIVAAAGDRPGKGHSGFFDLREQHVSSFEKQYLANLLRIHRGDMPAAAADARLPRGTLYRLLKNHELNPADFRP